MQGSFKKHKSDINELFIKGLKSNDINIVRHCLLAPDVLVNDKIVYDIQIYNRPVYVVITPVFFAMKNNMSGMFDVLVNNGRTKVNVFDNVCRQTLLTSSIYKTQNSYLITLLKHPLIDVNMENRGGYSVIDLAIICKISRSI